MVAARNTHLISPASDCQLRPTPCGIIGRSTNRPVLGVRTCNAGARQTIARIASRNWYVVRRAIPQSSDLDQFTLRGRQFH